MKYNTVVFFGGGGFIGRHLARHFIKHDLADKIVLADLREADLDLWPKDLRDHLRSGRVTFAKVDVRSAIENPDLPKNVDLIVNLAAVHKQPGHHTDEYFETNLQGAENVCSWAEAIGCERIIFTSSIAVYGAARQEKSEFSLPTPNSPYGISKLVAEKIHLSWQVSGQNRRLLIVRPGVIFGPGESGNVTHMVKAVTGGYFFYAGNKDVRKAGGYVKELCHAIVWMFEWQERNNLGASLFNFTMDPAPSLEDYATLISKVSGTKRRILNLPYRLLLAGAYLIQGAARLTNIRQPVDPVRIRKLTEYNNILPGLLRQTGYKYKYSLGDALSDWYEERPDDWSAKK